jgi:hypothetical protein
VEIFVFGSNLAGRHGAGSALAAVREHGAKWGQGTGLQGASYAIPTKDHGLRVLPLNHIKQFVDIFVQFAADHQEMTFNVVKVGCGLAGYREEEIAPLFAKAPGNCRLPEGWRR